jgi:hypothetical protein
MTVLDRYRCFYCLLTDGQSARGSVATVCNPVVAVSKNVPSRLSLERMVANTGDVGSSRSQCSSYLCPLDQGSSNHFEANLA